MSCPTPRPKMAWWSYSDMHAPTPASKVTTRQVFAIAGPAMIANLTTPLIGIVSTTAIGRLGDATLLGGVAMASVLFDCLFWLFAFLRMSTVAFTAQSLGAGETTEWRAILARARGSQRTRRAPRPSSSTRPRGGRLLPHPAAVSAPAGAWPRVCFSSAAEAAPAGHLPPAATWFLTIFLQR